MTVQHNLEVVRQRIRRACASAARAEDSVRLLLATKLQPPSVLQSAIDAGATLFGENRIQEALRKIEEMPNAPVSWHFIGHLQSNKVRDALRFATCIESVGTVSLAMALDKELQRQGRALDVLSLIHI